jgi:CRISPR/Cas system CSM-associated protein Csm2 small subunit
MSGLANLYATQNLQVIFSVLDEYKDKIEDDVYLHICNRFKTLYNNPADEGATTAPVQPVVRAYTTNEHVGRPRRLPDDLNELTPSQRQRRLWNANNKEKIQLYNKQRREKKKLEKTKEALDPVLPSTTEEH